MKVRSITALYVKPRKNNSSYADYIITEGEKSYVGFIKTDNTSETHWIHPLVAIHIRSSIFSPLYKRRRQWE